MQNNPSTIPKKEIEAMGNNPGMMSEAGRLEQENDDLKKEIIALAAKVGDAYYSQWAAQAYDFEKINEICLMLRERKKQVDANENNIRALRVAEMEALQRKEQEELQQKEQEKAASDAGTPEGITCACGFVSKAGTKFCIRCGSSLVMKKPEMKVEEPAPRSCACGNPLSPGAVFCTKCGAKV